MGISVHRGFCGCCVRVAKWLPVLFITGIVSWSYYAFVIELCFLTVLTNDGWMAVLTLLILYHLLLSLFLWAYYATIFTSPGRVPKSFRLSSMEMDTVESESLDPKSTLEQLAVAKDLPVFMRSIHGEIRYCSECYHIKPDRCHHCSVCNRCILKMDHHCPWVNNCVGFKNYKCFILFLGYAVTYCLFVALSTLKYFLTFWSTSEGIRPYGKFHVLFLFLVSAMFCISVTSLFVYHLYLVSRNRTTLESFRSPIFNYNLSGDKNGFSLGTRANFQEVFGDQALLWFFPVPNSFGDGLVFPQSGVVDEEMGTATATSRERGFKDELVPMINATKFEDESDEDNLKVWTDRHNQMMTKASSENSSITSSEPAILGLQSGDFSEVNIRQSPKVGRGENTDRAVTGDLISVDTA